MSTKKAERPVKALKDYSRAELVDLLAKQRKLLSDGVAAKLPDKGERIKKTIEKIEQLIKESPTPPVDELESNFSSLSLKPKPVAIPAASIGDLVAVNPEPRSPPTITMKDDILSPTARPIVKKLFDVTDDPEYNRLRKEHLDLFVRGRRGIKVGEKKGFKGATSLGLEESINLREEQAWRTHGDTAGMLMGDENERTVKYEVANGQEGDEELEYEEPEGAIIELDEETNNSNNMNADIKSGKQAKRREGEKGKKVSVGKEKEKEKEKEKGPVWDVQEDIKDILDLIPQEYKQPQKR